MTRAMLAIDTSAGTSVALLQGGQLLAEANHDQGLRHAELIGESIAQVLRASGLRAAQVGTVAVGRGPALFTGLRVGIAAATMFAAATHSRLLGAVSIDALALRLLTQDEALRTVPLLVSTDARRGEIYWALYAGLDSHGLPNRLDGPAVGKHDDVAQLLANRSGTHGELVERTGGATAFWVAKLVEGQLVAGSSSQETSALYLRAPDATEPKPAGFGKRVSG